MSEELSKMNPSAVAMARLYMRREWGESRDAITATAKKLSDLDKAVLWIRYGGGASREIGLALVELCREEVRTRS